MDAFTERLVVMPEQINDLIQVQKAPETMSFLELRRLRLAAGRVGAPGEQISRCSSTPSSRSPLVHVIMAVVAIPFALVSPRSGGRGVGIAVAILISVGYWVVHSVAIAFAKAELLPPDARRLDRQYHLRGNRRHPLPPRSHLNGRREGSRCEAATESRR